MGTTPSGVREKSLQLAVVTRLKEAVKLKRPLKLQPHECALLLRYQEELFDQGYHQGDENAVAEHEGDGW
jgi:hypothetical protein